LRKGAEQGERRDLSADKRLEALQRQAATRGVPAARWNRQETEEPSVPDEKVPLDNVSEEAEV
jgi:hypothetical protein